MRSVARLVMSSLLLTLFLWSGSVQADPPNEGTPVPVTIEVPKEGLDAQGRELVAQLAKRAQRNLFYWAGLTFEPPDTLFPEGVENIELKSLFVLDAKADLHAATHDETGARRELTAEQWEQIRNEGLVVVPSVKYPGMKHVFRLRAWVVRGKKDITMRVEKANDAALYMVTILVPDQILRKTFSLRAGLKGIAQGLSGTLRQLVGLWERDRVHSPEEVDRLILAEQQKYLRQQFDLLTGGGAPPFAVRLEMYDEALMKKVLPLLVACQERSLVGFEAVAQRIRQEMEADLERRGVDKGTWEQLVVDAIAKEKQERFYAQIESDRAVEALSPGLGAVLVDHGRALQIIHHDERAFRADLQTARRAEEERLRTRYVRGRFDEWVQQRGHQFEETQYQQRRAGVYNGIVQRLEQGRHFQDAFVMKATVEFLQNDAGKLRLRLEHEKTAAREYVHSYDRWLVSRWKPYQDEHGHWHAGNTVDHRTSSDSFGWRWRNVIQRIGQVWNNVMKWYVMDQWVNGVTGIRTLAPSSKPFFGQMMVDGKTGAIVPVPESETHTVWGNVGRIYQGIHNDWTRFNEREESAFGMRWAEWLIQAAYSNVLKGVVLPFVYVPSHIVATILLGAGNALAPFAATCIAPVASLAMWGWSAVVEDFDAARPSDPRHWPLVQHLVGRLGIAGIAQAVGLGIAAPIVLTAASLATWTWAGVSWIDRTVWDRTLGVGLLMAIRAKQPTASYPLLINQISGPGMSRDHYYAIDTQLALGAVLAQLESAELAFYRHRMDGIVGMPEAAMHAALKDLQGIMGRMHLELKFVSSDPLPEPLATIVGTSKGYRAQLAKLLEARALRIKPLTDLSHAADKPLRLTQAQLDAIIPQVAGIARKAYTERIFAAFPNKVRNESIAKFWNDLSLQQDDWTGVAKILLVNALGKGVLQPAEEVDHGFQVTVTSPDLVGNLVDAILDGKGLRTEDVVAPRHPVEASRPQVTPTYVSVGPQELCADGIAAAGRRILADH